MAGEIRESLYVHRLLSTRQINELHTPGASLRWTRKVLADLARAGLVEYVVARRRDAQHLWFLSERGGDAVEAAIGSRLGRRAQVTSEGADGDLQAHTLECNDVGIAFVQAARRRGDDCGHLSWRHEVSHPIGPRSGTPEIERVRADAVLRYTYYSRNGAQLRAWFLELDRATTSTGELLEKLHRYARLRGYRPDGETEPGWRALYPLGFPGLLVVFSGRRDEAAPRPIDRGPDRFGYRLPPKPRTTLERRMRLICRLAQRDREKLGGLSIACALLEDLVERGPLAPVWRKPGQDVPGYMLGGDANAGPAERAAA